MFWSDDAGSRASVIRGLCSSFMDARRECVRLVRCVYIGTGLCSGQTFGVTFAYIYPHVWSAPSRGFHALRGSAQMRDRTVVAGDGGGSTRRTWLSGGLGADGLSQAKWRCGETVCMHALCTLVGELALPRLDRLVCMRPQLRNLGRSSPTSTVNFARAGAMLNGNIHRSM